MRHKRAPLCDTIYSEIMLLINSSRCISFCCSSASRSISTNDPIRDVYHGNEGLYGMNGDNKRRAPDIYNNKPGVFHPKVFNTERSETKPSFHEVFFAVNEALHLVVGLASCVASPQTFLAFSLVPRR